MMDLRFDKRFPVDLAATIQWYERVSPEACDRLRASITDRLVSISEFPESFQLLTTGRGHRGSSISGFPWLIVFRIEKDNVRLLRIVHLSSDWQ